MAKKTTKRIDLLPGSTKIEVVAIAPGKDPIKKEMTIDQADALPKKTWLDVSPLSIRIFTI